MPDRLDDFVCNVSSEELAPDWLDNLDEEFFYGLWDDEDDYR